MTRVKKGGWWEEEWMAGVGGRDSRSEGVKRSEGRWQRGEGTGHSIEELGRRGNQGNEKSLKQKEE